MLADFRNFLEARAACVEITAQALDAGLDALLALCNARLDGFCAFECCDNAARIVLDPGRGYFDRLRGGLDNARGSRFIACLVPSVRRDDINAAVVPPARTIATFGPAACATRGCATHVITGCFVVGSFLLDAHAPRGVGVVGRRGWRGSGRRDASAVGLGAELLSVAAIHVAPGIRAPLELVDTRALQSPSGGSLEEAAGSAARPRTADARVSG